MRNFTKDELKNILNKHLKWLRNEDGGKRADLRYADLRSADLSSANLSSANLSSANLSSANLSSADLSSANLSSADLSSANLSSANLSSADLSSAYLRYADLSSADLRYADLSSAKLRSADLRYADLSSANLSSANLSSADLSYADLQLNLLNKFSPIACPEYGSFVAWKKCRNATIVKLEICEDAMRSSAFGRKCRCSAAKVMEIQNTDGTPYDGDSVASGRDSAFIYKVGEIVKVDDFDEDRRNECSTGIHFFITRQEAVDYEL